MKTLINLILLLFFSQPGGIYDQAEIIIRKNVGAKAEVQKFSLKLEVKLRAEIERSLQQKFFDDNISYWKIYSERKIINYAFLDNVYGKTLPITFLVILTPEGKVANVSIIKYREQYGTGITNENWLKQFVNFGEQSDFSVGNGIQGISGATISANSVSKGVGKIVKLFERIKNEL